MKLITRAEVEQALESLKTERSVEQDEIPIEILKFLK